MTEKRNTADISSVDLARGLVILMSGEEVPITNIISTKKKAKVEVKAQNLKLRTNPITEYVAPPSPEARDFAMDYKHVRIGKSLLIHADAFEWLARVPPESLNGMVFDPPYGVKEYELKEIERMMSGGTGIWRLPPAFDGSTRAPLPRFTALVEEERATLHRFFRDLAIVALPALKPGAHLFMASNAFLSQLVFGAMVEGGFEFRTEIVRLVQTLRGGDRPKLGEKDFPDVCSLPRGGYEPWGLFRKPLPPKMTVRECLRIYGTGGLRRRADGNPFNDVIPSERTPRRERDIAAHPSLKPQSLLRQVVRAVLPLGKGVIADPFMGSGSTVAAAEAVGYECIGVERYEDYFNIATKAVPQLKSIRPSDKFSGIGGIGCDERRGRRVSRPVRTST